MSEPIGNIVNGLTTNGVVQPLRSVGNLLINSTAISDLTDASISGPSSGQALVWNSSTGKWNNQSLLFASSLGDVVITAPQASDKILYDSATSKWTNQVPRYYNICVYGKFKDSYMSSLTSTTFINMLYNDPLVFDSYNISNTEISGLTIDSITHSVTGFKPSAIYNSSYTMNLSINTINATNWSFGTRTTLNVSLNANTNINILDNKTKTLDSCFTANIASTNLIYPYITLGSGTNNYSGQATQDFSFTYNIYEI